MNFLGILLFPFTVLYDAITRFRNHLYDTGYKRSFSFDRTIINVGNLSVGGTGKTPMVEYIIRLLKGRNLVTLSRGYGRRSKGFRLASDDDTPGTVGDEPYQFFNKFSDISVAVGEERALAIPFILAELPETEVIVLDDAFQHRTVQPDLNILLTDHRRPFYDDYVLPSGRLREARKGAKRADIIVITKCPDKPDYHDVEKKVRNYNRDAHVAFSTIRYLPPQRFSGVQPFSSNIFLFTGIAKPETLKDYISRQYNLIGTHYFKDHHHYTEDDLKMLYEQLNSFHLQEKCLVTTEKDMVKLLPLVKKAGLETMPLFYIPIETAFIKGGQAFDEMVLSTCKE